jgi:hypothetical protein
LSLCIRLFQLLGRSCTSLIIWTCSGESCPSCEFYQIPCLHAEDLHSYHRLGRAVHGRIVSIAGASYRKNQPSPLLCLPSRFPFGLFDFTDALCWSCPSSKCNQISCLNAEELRSYHRLGSAVLHMVASSALLAHHTVKTALAARVLRLQALSLDRLPAPKTPQISTI